MSFAAFPSASVSVDAAADAPLDAQLYTMIELEGSRYRAFFAKLTQGSGLPVAREAALEFFRKSSLSEEQVQELYARLQALRLPPDAGDGRVGETAFVMGMHLIVCMTKRGLARIPAAFPSYLFPSLHLSPPSSSLDAPSDAPLSFTATSPASPAAPLADATSLAELVATQLRAQQHEAQVLSRVDQAAARAVQSLQACVERVADQVDGLGFPVPSAARSLDALDDLKNLLQKHVHAAKQEIQSMQIDAQMRSVASEVAQNDGPRGDPLKVAGELTQELLALQHQTAQLMARKTDVLARLVAVKSGGSAAGSFIQQSGAAFAEASNPAFALSKGALTVGELGTASASTTPPKGAGPALMQSHNSASSGGWGTFGAATPNAPAPAQPFGVKADIAADPFGFGRRMTLPGDHFNKQCSLNLKSRKLGARLTKPDCC
ncbi:EF-hand domain pair [Phytophthora cinnamomi]|uniref:EF-hand domain pair n=1 Tax=Phytophthora cinnamomi TaxID=4785 RepID=UPI00355A9131|nr:EF-hand domain pair [Phytophthora cinnamomi]